MASTPDKPLMRCLGEFVGHIVQSVKSSPTKKGREINRSVQEKKDGNVTLRRTTIDEIEFEQEDTKDV
ncbi:MAG: hypothetical protein QGI78_01270 [Phycisphaerales bacterium]|jgi:hypothetical protein|nr:hypothetical protein [Phycisphaerales bacterium]